MYLDALRATNRREKSAPKRPRVHLNAPRRQCPEWDSNPHWIDFESIASAGWAIGANQ